MGYYTAGAQIDPVGPTTGSGRVVRGGSWIDYGAHSARVSRRFDYYPSDRGDRVGFRLALSP